MTSMYNQLPSQLNAKATGEIVEIESLMSDLSPDMMMADDACMDFVSEILSFEEDCKTPFIDLYPNLHEQEDCLSHHQSCRCDGGDGGVPGDFIFQAIKHDQLEEHSAQLKHLIESQQLCQHRSPAPSNSQQKLSCFIKEETMDENLPCRNHSIYQKQLQLQQLKLHQQDNYSKANSLEGGIDFFPYFHHSDCHYGDEGDNENNNIDKEVYEENKMAGLSIENIEHAVVEETDVISRVLSACKLHNLPINPCDWTVDEANRWLYWVLEKICFKLKQMNARSAKNSHTFQHGSTSKQSHLDDIVPSPLPLHEVTTTHATDGNGNDLLSGQCDSLSGKNFNFSGAQLCGMSQETIVKNFKPLGESVYVELEMWKNACCLLESVGSTAVFSPFDTSCNDHDHQNFFNDIFQSSSNPSHIPSHIPLHIPCNTASNKNSYMDEFSKQPHRPNTLPFYSHLSNSADPVLSQPSFFISPSSVNDYNCSNNNNNYHDRFMQTCFDINTNSFPSSSSASPCSIQSDLYDPSYAPSNEPQAEPCVQSTRQGNQLWQFLKELLHQPKQFEACIRWLDRQKGIFKIEDSIKVAKLWGERKNRPAMNYDKLSRSIRQYYKKGIIKKTTQSKRLVYQFCQRYL